MRSRTFAMTVMPMWLAALGAQAAMVNFDVYPGPDGELGTSDDILATAGDEITDQYEGLGVIIENAVSSTGLPGLYVVPQGPSGSSTQDIVPTTYPFAAAPLDVPFDLETSSTGFIRFKLFPSADDFCMDFLDIEGSGSPGTENTYVDVTYESGGSKRLLVPSGPNASQVPICDIAPSGDTITQVFVSLNDGVSGGESGAIDSLNFTRTSGRCWLTTGGHLKASVKGGKSVHSFGGNVGPPPSGSWEHVDHEQGLNFHSFDAALDECFNDGGAGPGNPKADVNVVRFSGTGRLNGEFGYSFEAQMIDRGEPGKKDRYSIRVYKDGVDYIVVDDQQLSGGNAQVHPAK